MNTAIHVLSQYEVADVLDALGLVQVGKTDWAFSNTVYVNPQDWADPLEVVVFDEPDRWPTLAHAVTDLLECIMDEGETYQDVLDRILPDDFYR